MKGRSKFISPQSSYFYDRTPYVPLGISYLAASIQDIADQIDCVDGQMLSADDYEQAIAKTASDVVCISAALLQMKDHSRIVAFSGDIFIVQKIWMNIFFIKTRSLIGRPKMF